MSGIHEKRGGLGQGRGLCTEGGGGVAISKRKKFVVFARVSWQVG